MVTVTIVLQVAILVARSRLVAGTTKTTRERCIRRRDYPCEAPGTRMSGLPLGLGNSQVKYTKSL